MVTKKVRITNTKCDSDKKISSICSRFYLGIEVDENNNDIKDAKIVIVGNMPQLHQNMIYTVGGNLSYEGNDTRIVVENVDFERKMDRSTFIISAQKALVGIRVTKKELSKAYDEFGEDSWERLTNEAELIIKNTDKALKVKERLGSKTNIHKASTYLREFGFNSAQISSVLEYYEDDEKRIKFELTNSPYNFVIGNKIKGVGFKTVDRIALERGIKIDDTQRLSAGIEYTLKIGESEKGHCFLTKRQLLYQLMNELGFKAKFAEEYCKKYNIDISVKRFFQEIKKSNNFGLKHKSNFDKEIKPFRDKITNIIDEKIKKGEVKSRKIPKKYIMRDMDVDNGDALYDVYYIPFIYYMENYIADKLKDITSIESEYDIGNINNLLDEMVKKDLESGELIGNGLTEEQRKAIIGVVTNKVSILTGSAGTGKTLTTKYILKVFKALGIKHIAVTAPTGKAADKAGKITGQVGKTIHSHLEYKFDGCGRNEDNPLTDDTILLDEFSMLDLSLTNYLLKAIQSKTILVLIGDVEQLPSVGSGFISGDFMSSGVVSTFRLTKVFRQENGSDLLGICDDCRLYSKTRKLPKLNYVRTLKDLTFKEENMTFNLNDFRSDKQVIDTVDYLVNNIQKKMGFNEIQFLTSQYKGNFGIDRLNNICQKIFNPNAVITKRLELNNGFQDLKTGDRVIHLVNNKDMEMFNGEVGNVLYIKDEKAKGEVGINYPDGKGGKKLTIYNFKQLKMIKHAYCISTHKSQGGEFEVVFMFMTRQDYYMLERRLIYTAFTRAKKLLVLFLQDEEVDEMGNHKKNILELGLGRDPVISRNTSLHYLLDKE